jgi:hypothetical protein
MEQLQRVLLLLVSLTVSSVGCGSSPTTASTVASISTFHAEATDPAGDAVVSAGVATPPDMVHSTVDVAGGAVTFTVQFAPGTMNTQTTRLDIQLDTDQNASTGVSGGNGVGIDYILDLWAARTQQTLVQQAQPATCANGGSCYTDVGVASISMGINTMSTTVSLSVLGNASGRINYRIFAYASPQATTPTVVADVMPDTTLPPAHIP